MFVILSQGARETMYLKEENREGETETETVCKIWSMENEFLNWM